MKGEKKVNGDKITLVIASVVFVVSVLLVFSSGITAQTQSATGSNVTISKFLAISLSANLTEGINYGTVLVLPTANQNATGNYNGLDDILSTPNSNTTFFVNVSIDSNTPVDVCINANGPFIDSISSDQILLGQSKYVNSTLSDALNQPVAPDGLQEVAFATTFAKSGETVVPGDVNYYRFWLDVPSQTPAGQFNNTVFFKGVQTTLAC